MNIDLSPSAPLSARAPFRALERGEGGGAALADHPLAALHERSRSTSDLRGRVGGAVVGDPHRRAGEGLSERGQGRADAVGLVVGGDDDEGVAGHVRSAAQAIVCGGWWRSAFWRCRWLRWRPTSPARYGKSSAPSGDAVEEGDTVAILESMKMEMPVEAEDSGTVAEIRCEEGQAVNEGDTLVVLE